MATISQCRSCGSSDLTDVLNLGSTPLANSLLDRSSLEQPEPKAPLVLVFCSKCSLVQITETVPPETLFREYAYFSSFSDTVLENARSICKRLISERCLNSKSLVMEIASNDGYLLKNYIEESVPVLGIEPALNIAEEASRKGIETISEFFGADLAGELASQGRRADVIHANNVLAHVPDLNGVVEGIRLALKDDGVAVIEVPYVRDLIDKLEFDTIYHEHLCYFSATALNQLFERNQLILSDIERLPIHGGSLRLFVTRDGARSKKVLEILDEESSCGVDKFEFYLTFSKRVRQLREELNALLSDLKADGKQLAAYGASAKGSTLLNFCGINGDTIDYVVDRSTVKQGLYTPGTHLPIYPPDRLLSERPDYVLLLSWNHADEIIEQQSDYIDRGGKFVLPLPIPVVVGGKKAGSPT